MVCIEPRILALTDDRSMPLMVLVFSNGRVWLSHLSATPDAKKLRRAQIRLFFKSQRSAESLMKRFSHQPEVVQYRRHSASRHATQRSADEFQKVASMSIQV